VHPSFFSFFLYHRQLEHASLPLFDADGMVGEKTPFPPPPYSDDRTGLVRDIEKRTRESFFLFFFFFLLIILTLFPFHVNRLEWECTTPPLLIHWALDPPHYPGK